MAREKVPVRRTPQLPRCSQDGVVALELWVVECAQCAAMLVDLVFEPVCRQLKYVKGRERASERERDRKREREEREKKKSLCVGFPDQ